MLKVFGCLAYYHVNEGKLEPRAKKGVFMGHGNGVKRFRIWSPLERKVILSIDGIFYELFILHSKFLEDSNKETDFTKQVEFKSPTIKNFSDQQQFKAPNETDLSGLDHHSHLP